MLPQETVQFDRRGGGAAHRYGASSTADRADDGKVVLDDNFFASHRAKPTAVDCHGNALAPVDPNATMEEKCACVRRLVSGFGGPFGDPGRIFDDLEPFDSQFADDDTGPRAGGDLRFGTFKYTGWHTGDAVTIFQSGYTGLRAGDAAT